MKTRVLAVIPVNSLSSTKSRLRTVLNLQERQAFTLNILSRTIQTLKCLDKDQYILVLTPDDRVLSFVKGLRVIGLKEEGKGLNPALGQATRWAIEQGFGAILILPCDIPLLNSEDIKTILRMGVEGERVVVIAPNKGRNGTNVLFVKPPGILKYSFGVNSFERHLQQAMAQNVKFEVYSSASAAFDLDTSEEYRLLLEKKHIRQKALGYENEAGHIDSNSWNSHHPTWR